MVGDKNLLSPASRQCLGDDAGSDIRGAAGTRGHDQLYRRSREILRPRYRHGAHGQSKNGGDQEAAEFPGLHDGGFGGRDRRASDLTKIVVNGPNGSVDVFQVGGEP